MEIANRRVATVHFTLTGEDGSRITSTRGHEPLTYMHGTGGIARGPGRYPGSPQPPRDADCNPPSASEADPDKVPDTFNPLTAAISKGYRQYNLMIRSRPKGGGLDSLGTSWGCAMGLPLSIPGGQRKKILFLSLKFPRSCGTLIPSLR